MLRIGLDIDNCLADFNLGYLERFGNWPKHDWVITRNVANILVKEREFWLNLPVLRYPNFVPKLYCSARVNNRRWTKKYLVDNGFPKAPLFQVPGYKLSKARVLKGRVDVFIDDSLKNFLDLNNQGIPCLLMDSPLNQEWGPVGRIYSLDIEEIEDTYELMMLTDMFTYVKT